MEAIFVDEWTDDREAGALGFRLVRDDAGDFWLEMRVEEDGAWSEWAEEDLDGPGDDLLARLPALLAAERDEERARIRRELLGLAAKWEAVYRLATPESRDLRAALDRICPEE